MFLEVAKVMSPAIHCTSCTLVVLFVGLALGAEHAPPDTGISRLSDKPMEGLLKSTEIDDPKHKDRSHKMMAPTDLSISRLNDEPMEGLPKSSENQVPKHKGRIHKIMASVERHSAVHRVLQAKTNASSMFRDMYANGVSTVVPKPHVLVQEDDVLHPQDKKLPTSSKSKGLASAKALAPEIFLEAEEAQEQMLMKPKQDQLMKELGSRFQANGFSFVNLTSQSRLECSDFYDKYAGGSTLDYKGKKLSMKGCCFGMTLRRSTKNGQYRCKPGTQPGNNFMCRCPAGAGSGCAFEQELTGEAELATCTGQDLSQNCHQFYDEYKPKKTHGNTSFTDLEYQGVTASPVGCCFQLESRDGMCKPAKTSGMCKCPGGGPTCAFERNSAIQLKDCTGEDMTPSLKPGGDWQCNDFFDKYASQSGRSQPLEYGGVTDSPDGCCFGMTLRKSSKNGQFRCKPASKQPSVSMCRCPGGSAKCGFETKLKTEKELETCKLRDLQENCGKFYDQYKPKKVGGNTSSTDLTYEGVTASPVGCCFQLERRGEMCKPAKTAGMCKCPGGAPTCAFEKNSAIASKLPACTGTDMTPSLKANGDWLCSDFYDKYASQHNQTLSHGGVTASMDGCCFSMTVRKSSKSGQYRCKPSNKEPDVGICKCPGGSTKCKFENQLSNLETCTGRDLKENCNKFYDQYEPKGNTSSAPIKYEGVTASPAGCCFQLVHRGGMCKPDKTAGMCKCPGGAPTCEFEKKSHTLPACAGVDMTPDGPEESPAAGPAPADAGGGKAAVASRGSTGKSGKSGSSSSAGDSPSPPPESDEDGPESHAERASAFGMVAVLFALYEVV